MVTYQWHIFRADLNPVQGSEQAGTRPVLVISSEAVNRPLPIVTVLSLASAKPERAIYPTEVFLPKEQTGLPRDSIAMAHQIRAISKERLKEPPYGELREESTRGKIREAVQLYLDLPHK